jgi:hypothetical protein
VAARRRLAGWAAACAGLVAVVAVAVLGAAGPAAAADAPNSLSIDGGPLRAPIAIRANQEPDLFNEVLKEVGWMATRASDPISPDPAKLGVKYTLKVMTNNAPVQVYEIFPEAPGGPRAHRPAAQPRGQVSEAWFYASVSLPDLLRAGGVPVATPSVANSNGLEYGDPAGFVPAAASSEAPPFSLQKIFGGQTRPLLLWAASAFVVLLMVFGAARLSRRGR